MEDHGAAGLVETPAALDAAYRRLGEACDEARRVLMDSQPGRLPSRWECRPQDRCLLDEIERAEREVDRLRRLSTAPSAATAARRAAFGARRTVLDGAARREREAERAVELRVG